MRLPDWAPRLPRPKPRAQKRRAPPTLAPQRRASPPTEQKLPASWQPPRQVTLQLELPLAPGWFPPRHPLSRPQQMRVSLDSRLQQT